MQFRIMGIMIVLLCSALVLAGCTGTRTSPGVTPPGSVTIPGTGHTSGSPAGTLTTEPTSVVPSYNYVVVDVGVKDYLGNSEVIYQGGEGQIHVKKITAKMTRADGQTQTESLENKKGYTVELLGTKQVDRVEVWVTMDNGETYKINDVLLDYRIH
jgi:hypothetical protein